MCKSGLRLPVGGEICRVHLYLSLPFNCSTVKDQKERRGLRREVSIRAGRVSASTSHSAPCRFSVHRCRIWAREAQYVSQHRPSASSPSSWLLKLCLAPILCFFGQMEPTPSTWRKPRWTWSPTSCVKVIHTMENTSLRTCFVLGARTGPLILAV